MFYIARLAGLCVVSTVRSHVPQQGDFDFDASFLQSFPVCCCVLYFVYKL
jgi:hypothetical protein